MPACARSTSAIRYQPKEIGYYIPAITDNTDKRCVGQGADQHCKVAIQTNNVEVDDRGYIYIVDRANTGMHILADRAGARGGGFQRRPTMIRTKTTRTMTLTIALSGVLASLPLHAQWLNQPTPGIPRGPGGKPDLSAPAPRTPDGKPDLSGLWNKISPKYSRNIAADLKPGEVQPWAEALVEQRKEDLGRSYMNVLCVPLGPGYTTAADSTGSEMMKIIQTPALIIILNPELDLSPDLHGRPRTRIRAQPELDGLLRGPLGRRHAGGGELRLQ